jgi:hypothetical protein
MFCSLGELLELGEKGLDLFAVLAAPSEDEGS